MKTTFGERPSEAEGLYLLSCCWCLLLDFEQEHYCYLIDEMIASWFMQNEPSQRVMMLDPHSAWKYCSYGFESTDITLDLERCRSFVKASKQSLYHTTFEVSNWHSGYCYCCLPYQIISWLRKGSFITIVAKESDAGLHNCGIVRSRRCDLLELLSLPFKSKHFKRFWKT